MSYIDIIRDLVVPNGQLENVMWLELLGKPINAALLRMNGGTMPPYWEQNNIHETPEDFQPNLHPSNLYNETITPVIQKTRKRKRTGIPYVDGLVTVEANPGFKKGGKSKPTRKLKEAVKKEVIREEKKIPFLQPPRGTSSGNGNMMPPRKERAQAVTTSTVPVGYGSSVRNNQYSIGKVDNCIADCVRTNGINVKGTCFSNLGVGIVAGAAGDKKGLFLDGLEHTNEFIAFNFQDFDDRVAALATTHQYYRVRRLTAEYVPLVGTSTTGQWAFAINDNYNPSSGTAPTTINSLLTSATSGAGTPWIPRSIPSYIYNGAKVWSCPSASEDGSNANEYEQLTFIARYLNTVTPLDDIETGRMQFHYSIDFFEPRGNRGTITVDNINFDDLRLFLGPAIMRTMRHNKSAWRAPFIAALRKLMSDLELKTKSGKDEEYIISSEPQTPEVEENPLTRSIHLPQSTVQAILNKLK